MDDIRESEKMSLEEAHKRLEAAFHWMHGEGLGGYTREQLADGMQSTVNHINKLRERETIAGEFIKQIMEATGRNTSAETVDLNDLNYQVIGWVEQCKGYEIELEQLRGSPASGFGGIMRLQQIIDHLAAVVAEMNANSEHDMALKAQTAIVAVDAVQRACADYGSMDSDMVGDWPVASGSGGT